MALLFVKNKIFGNNSAAAAGKISSTQYHPLASESDPEHGPAGSESGTELTAVDQQSFQEYYDEDLPSEKTTSILADYFHHNSSRFFFNLTLGLSDGLTVPFALTAGLTRFGDTAVVRYGGLAEVVAGCISMGVGGFMSSKGEVDAYRSELRIVRKIVRESPEKMSLMIHETFAPYNLSSDVLTPMVEHFKASPEQAIDFILRFNRSSQSVDSTSRLTSVLAGLTISLGYGLGGMLPLLPYFMHSTLETAFAWSLTIMIIVLLAFGFTRSWFTEARSWKNAVQASVLFLFTGGTAVVAAMTCTKLISRE